MREGERSIGRWAKAVLYLFGVPFVLFLLLLAAWACGLIHIQLFPLPL